MYRNTPWIGSKSPLFKGPSQAEVGDWQRIRIAKCPHRNIRCRPRSDTRKFKQLCHRLFAVSVTVKHQAFLNNGVSKCL
jgi:hypothetical protein